MSFFVLALVTPPKTELVKKKNPNPAVLHRAELVEKMPNYLELFWTAVFQKVKQSGVT